MLNRRLPLLCASIKTINAGRQQLAQQFGSMDGWNSGSDARFDDYVAEERRKEAFEGFDQRVERAYMQSMKLHKAEVVNGFKRHLTSSKEKFTAATLLEMNRAVETRLEWLREVWTQIDADYRSGDSQRQESAANEISKALNGEASDFMAWVYEQKSKRRFKGPKGQAAMDAELEDASLPEVAEDEANRYLNLRTNMHEVERNVKEKYGIAGAQHWSMLQTLKNEEYEEKLDRAAEKYKELVDQQRRYDGSTTTQKLRSVLERTHEAKVRFQSAMEIEEEREKMVETHMKMKEERRLAASERAREQLRHASELRAQGKTTPEIAQALRMKALDEQVQRQDAYIREEKRTVEAKKASFLGLIDKMRRGVEEREGRMLMGRGGGGGDRRMSTLVATENDEISSSSSSNDADNNPFQLTPAEQEILNKVQQGASSTSSSLSSRRQNEDQVQQQEALSSADKQNLWRAIHGDTYEDPFRTVHQARLDADRNYDPLYSKMAPTELVIGSKLMRQGIGDQAAGNEQDRQILQAGNKVGQAFHWDNPHGIVHNLDRDGDNEYFLTDVFHVRDKKTGDIDWTKERRAGGPAFKGPRIYKMSARRDAKDPGSRPVDDGAAGAGAGGGQKSTGAQQAGSSTPRRVVTRSE